MDFIEMKNKKIAALVQKPLDIVNVFEFFDIKKWEKENAVLFVLGNAERTKSCIRIAEDNGVECIVMPNPDCYSILLKKYGVYWNGVMRYLFKLFLFCLSFFSWAFVYLYAVYYFRNKRYDALLFDPWRNKSLYASVIKSDHQVIIDGGYSTITYGLVETFRSHGPIAMVMKSIKKQRMTWAFIFRNKIMYSINKNAEFFTSYIENDEPELRLIKNDYKGLINSILSKRINDNILVVGAPGLTGMLNCMPIIKDISDSSKMIYRFHPVDVELMSNNAKYKKRLVDLVEDCGFLCEFSLNGLEYDLNKSNELPKCILVYDTSCFNWLEKINKNGFRLIRYVGTSKN